MLLRMSVENFRSVHAPVELSFVSTRLSDAPALRFPSPSLKYGVLPVVGVFGANASGKSNLLRAVVALRELVVSSFRLRPDQPIPGTPFAGAKHAPTRFEVDFLVGGVRHQYGFAHDRVTFLQEWLHRWPSRSRQVLFERDASANEPWYFGAGLRGERRSVASQTRPNALFLSTAAQLNHEQLGPVAAFFQGISRSGAASGLTLFSGDAPILQPRNRARVRAMLGAADVGVVDFDARALSPAQQQVFQGPVQALLSALAASGAMPQDASTSVFGDMRAVWLQRNGGWELPPEEESDGTQKMLTYVNELIPTLENGGLLVVDELDRSMHPELCGAIVALFTDPEVNRTGAQLLFSTHDITLLHRLRRDEAVFVDKDASGATHVRVASDFDGLRGREDLARVYAQGRLGGMPVLGDLGAAFDWTDDGAH